MATHSAWEQLIACAQCVNRTYISGRHGRPAAMTVCQKSAARKATTIMRRIRPACRDQGPCHRGKSAGRDRSCETPRSPASEPTSQTLIRFRFFQESAARKAACRSFCPCTPLWTTTARSRSQATRRGPRLISRGDPCRRALRRWHKGGGLLISDALGCLCSLRARRRLTG
jgi:hypothetical protein